MKELYLQFIHTKYPTKAKIPVIVSRHTAYTRNVLMWTISLKLLQIKKKVKKSKSMTLVSPNLSPCHYTVVLAAYSEILLDAQDHQYRLDKKKWQIHCRSLFSPNVLYLFSALLLLDCPFPHGVFFFQRLKKIFSLLFHSLQRIHLVKKEQKEKQ